MANNKWIPPRLSRGSYFLVGILAGSLALTVACSFEQRGTGKLIPNAAAGLAFPPTPTARPVVTPTPEPTPIPDPWHLETARSGKAFLDVLDEGCVNGKPAITVLSRFVANFNAPKIGVLGIIDLKKPGRPNPSILGIVGVSDSSGKGRDKRFYNGEAKPEKQFTDYPIPTVKLSDGHLYEVVVLPGQVVIGPTGKSKVRFENMTPLANQEFRVASSCSR